MNFSSYEEGVFNNSFGEDTICKALVYPSMRDYSIMPSKMFMRTNKICHLLWVCYIVDTFQTPLFNTHSILRLLGTRGLFWDTGQVNDKDQLQTQHFSGHQTNTFSRIAHLLENLHIKHGKEDSLQFIKTHI